MIEIRDWPATAGVVFGVFVIAMMALADGDLSREVELNGRVILVPSVNPKSKIENPKSPYIGEKIMAQTITVTDVVAAVSDKAILLERSRLPLATSDRQPWIPKSLIVQCDTDLDDIIRGEEITVELPVWLVEQKGIVE